MCQARRNYPVGVFSKNTNCAVWVCAAYCSNCYLFPVVDEAGGERHEEVVGDARSSCQNFFYSDQNWSNFI
ncbi:unnamed protein product [Blepharisma stoltei]|uniref:Uncharacterized protein n=1 Tax=Blepharisma stoltei TaxID=1481888 RepID=A0AAU9K4S5_9CILI|nr:unnamed protein product [Blepharisma stoltei]